MRSEDQKEPELKLKPRSRAQNTKVPRAIRVSSGLRALLKTVQMTYRKGSRYRSVLVKGASPRRTSMYCQRVIVNVKYSAGGKRQWRKHGRYLERESAQEGAATTKTKLGLASQTRLPELLEKWQKAGDPRVWKIIISPENPGVDFEVMTVALLKRMSDDLDQALEWAGIVHLNTDHPHAHLVVRGVDAKGRPVELPREFIQHTLRGYVTEEVTRQLGPRTMEQIQAAQERDVQRLAPTRIDKEIVKLAASERSLLNEGQVYVPISEEATLTPWQEKRLAFLASAGLALRDRGTWFLREDHQTVLNVLRLSNDRQRALLRHGAAISDHRLPFEIVTKMKHVAGRVLLHEEDEMTGKISSTIEGVDGKLYALSPHPALYRAWEQGKLKPGNFVEIEPYSSGERNGTRITDHGDAEAFLKTPQFSPMLLRLERQGLVSSDRWPTELGWLGRVYAAATPVFSPGSNEKIVHSKLVDREL